MAIKVLDLTETFHRDLLIHSMGKTQFKSPIPLSFFAYTAFWIVVFGVPFFLLTWRWLHMTVVVSVSAGIPVTFAILMSKPIWEGRKFSAFFGSLMDYWRSPKAFYEGRAGEKLAPYTIDKKILVDRTNDYKYLYELVKEEVEQNG